MRFLPTLAKCFRRVSSTIVSERERCRPAAIEPLESRIAPATFTGAGATLTIDLDNSNEIVTIHADAATITAQLVNGTATDGGGTGGNVSGFGSSTALIASSGFTAITIIDSAAGASVAFVDSSDPFSPGSYPQSFAITLDDLASGNITFTGVSPFTAGVTASTAAGFIASAATSLVAVTGGAGANLSLTATGHDILMKGTVLVSGTTTLAANVVQMDNPLNDFTGALQLSGPVVASVFDANDLNLATSNFAFGSLGQTTHIAAGGNITQSGALTATASNAATLDIASLGGSITLTNAGNNISSNVAVALFATGANTVSLLNSAALTLGDVKMATGLLSATANGNITQKAGTTIETGGAATFTVSSNNRDILLANSGNHIAGAVTIAETGVGFVRDVSLRNADDNASAPVGTPLTTAGNIRNLTVFFDNNGVALPGYSITGNLNVTAGGDVTQTAGLTIAGTTTATILGDFGITLTNAANAFTGAVSLNAHQGTQPVQLTSAGALTLGASDLGRGTLTVSALAGNLTSTVAITQEKGAGLATFSVPSGTISLTGANRFPGDVAFSGAATLNIRNADFMASFAHLMIPASVTDLTVTFDNVSAALPSENLTNLTVTAQGIAQQSGTSLTLTGTGTFNAGAFPLNLSNAANDFVNLSLANSGRNDVIVNETNDVAFSGNSNIGFGRLTLTAGGNITASGAGRITQSNAGPVGDVSLTSTGGGITLTNNNAIRGALSVTVSGANNVTIHNNNVALVLGDLTTGTGTFTIDAGTQGISQDPNSVLTLGGASSFPTTNATIALNNTANTFAGTIALTAANASLKAAGPVVLAASNVSAALSITTRGTASDSITQSGAITGGSTATFDTGAADVTLTNATNNFGSISVFSTGTTVAITDANALNVGTIQVGAGTLSLTAGGNLGLAGAASGIVQTTGSGAITLTTPAGSSISLSSAINVLRGPVAITNATNVTLQSQGDLTFAAPSVITGNLTAVAGGNLTLPTTVNVGTLTLSAASTTVASDATASGAISFTGAVNFVGNRTLTSGAGAVFTGDVAAGGTLTLNLANNQLLDLRDGIWNQGANALTINGSTVGFNVGDGLNGPARLIVSSATISMPGNGALTVGLDGTFQVGTNAAAAETATLANGAGALTINGTLAVGFGPTDELVKIGTGLVTLGATAKLRGSGLADGAPAPVLASQTALIVGHFTGSTDANGVPRDFFAGSDIVTPIYDFTSVSVMAGGVPSATGTVSGFQADGDKITVTSSLGAAAGLVTVEDANGRIAITVRNQTASAPSTLAITTTKSAGDGFSEVGGLAIHTPGAVTVSASTANFVGDFDISGRLSALTARDLGSAAASFALTDGGTASGTTTITARVVQNGSIHLGGVLSAFTAKSVTSGVEFTAQRFGTLKTTGDALANIVGDFDATLSSTTPTTGPVLTTASIAGTLSGVWDLRGSVGTVTAHDTTDWTFGTPGGANAHNGGLLTGATSLNLGSLANGVVNATGRITTLTAREITDSTLTAGSFGTVTTTGDVANGLLGTVANTILAATGNAGGTSALALGTLSIKGDWTSSSLILLDGNTTTISVGRSISGVTINADDANGRGTLTTLQAAKVQNTTIAARAIGTLKVTGNAAASLLGDVTNSDVTLSGSNVTGNALGTFSASGSVTGSAFDVQHGNVGTFTVGRQLDTTSVTIFGNLTSLTAGELTSGVTILAKTIGTLKTTGAAQISPASPALIGGIANATITAYLDSGTAPAIGTLSVAGDLSATKVVAEHGITSATIKRSVTSSFIIADDAMTGASSVGRVGSLTAGAWASSTASANTFGTVKTTGFTQSESGTPNFTPGDVTIGTFLAHGATLVSPLTGIGTMSVAGNFQTNSVVSAPSGITTMTVGGAIVSSKVVADNPTAPASGSIGNLTAKAIESATIRGGRIGSLQTVTGTIFSGLLGNVDSSTIAATSGAGTPGALIAIGTLSVAGDFTDSVLDAPAKVTTITVGGRIAANATDTRIQAGYAAGSKLVTLKAGAWGQPGAVLSTELVTQSVGTFTLTGNASRGFAGTSDRGFIDILGASNGVGLGTFSAAGAATNSLFRVSDGDVTSFTIARMISSDLLVGFRFAKADDITATPAAANWTTTNHKIGTFKTTGIFSPTDVDNSASFVDSNVVAGKLGAITISGVHPAALDSTAFGVAFRTSAGASAAGVVKINGSATALTAPFASAQFNYLGLAG